MQKQVGLQNILLKLGSKRRDNTLQTTIKDLTAKLFLSLMLNADTLYGLILMNYLRMKRSLLRQQRPR